MKQFFNLKSNFYFLQKLVFAIFCFLLGFLLGSGILSAKALTTFDMTTSFDAFKELNYTYYDKTTNTEINYKENLDRLVSILNEKNLKYIIYFDNFSSKTGYGNVNVELLGSNTDLVIYNYENSFSHYHKDINNITSSNYLRFNKVYFSMFTVDVNNMFDYLCNYLLENNTIPTERKIVGNHYLNYSEGNMFALTFSTSGNNYSLIYDTNVNFQFKSVNYNDIKLNSTIYSSEIPVYSKIQDYGYVKKVYTENFRISSSNIDRIEYVFDLENNDNPIHEFNFSTTWYSNIARGDLFSPPYLEYMQNNISYKLPLDAYKKSTLDEVVYYDTQINPFMNIQELKFVVDFSNIHNLDEGANSEVLIHFDSSLNFTRKIIYTNDIDSNLKYYEEVDWSNKYGIYLIPKVIKNNVNQEVYSNVLYHAKGLKIEVFDSVDTSIPPVSSKHDYNNVGGLWGNFNYLFRFNNKNQMLFFTNKDYLNDIEPTKIKYDTRYFVYSICDTEYNCQPVINPNTGEEIRPTPPVDKDEWNLDDIFDVLDDFLDKVKETRNYFNDCFNAFWAQLPAFLQTIIIVIYIMLNIIVLLRIGGWSND